MRRRQCGITLIELIVFIVIVSIALAGTLSVLNLTSAKSADPMIRKQMISIAEALMDEVTLQSFAFCNGADANVKTALAATVGGANCATTVQAFGYDVGGSRGTFSSILNYCNVAANSTGCPAMSGSIWGLGNGTATGTITDITGTGLASPPGYSATITLTPAALGGIASAAPAAANNATALNVVLVTVTVSNFFFPDETLTLQSFRTRWAPRII